MDKDSHLTTYELFESQSDESRRLLRQEELILEVSEAIVDAMQTTRTTRSQLKSKLGHGSMLRQNLTLRMLSDIADAMGCRVRVEIREVRGSRGEEN